MIKLFSMSRGLLGVCVILVLIWQCVVFLRPQPREWSRPEEEAVCGVVELLAGKLHEQAAALGAGPVRIGLLGFSGDEGGQGATLVREVLGNSSEWEIEKHSVPVKFLTDVGEALKEASTLEDVLGAGQKVDLDWILGGKIHSVTPAGEGARASLEFHVWNVRAGDWLLRERMEFQWVPGFWDDWAGVMQRMPGWMRLCLWCLAVLLLPFLTPFLVEHAVERRSNWASLGVWALYSGFGGFLACVFTAWGRAFDGSVWWYGAGALFVVLYNYWACERLAA